MSTAFDTATIIDDLGYGTLWSSAGWSVQVGREPTEPTECITVYDTPGQQPWYNDEVERPGIQIRVRGKSGSGYPDAYAKIEGILHDLVYGGSREHDGVRYWFWADGYINLLQFDDRDRPIFVVNLRTTRAAGGAEAEENSGD